MKKNNSFNEIAEKLKGAEKVIIYPHVNMDGDSFGSCIALCRALRKMNKESLVFVGEKIPDNLKFLEGDFVIRTPERAEDCDIAMCIDSGEISRLSWRGETFAKAPYSICIDHHRTSEPFCNLNHIDPDAAATGQLIFKLIKALGVEPDRWMGDALFTAITMDTGNFQYSNTSKETHLIAAELYDWGAKPSDVSIELYENDRIEKFYIETEVFDHVEIIAEGQVAVAYVTQDMLKKTGAMMDETDGIVPKLRSIRGVEVAIFLKEHGPETIKVSLRSKSRVDVAEISAALGGGGHARAAGCTLKTDIDTAKHRIIEAVTEAVEG